MRAKKIPMLTELNVQAPIQELDFIEWAVARVRICSPFSEISPLARVRISWRCLGVALLAAWF